MRKQTTIVVNGRKGNPFVYFLTHMQTGVVVGVAVRELKSRQYVTKKTANLKLIGKLKID